MKTSLSVTDTARNFSDIINRVTYKGEKFILLKGKKAVAEISPVKTGRPLSELQEVLESLPALSSDELEDFATDLERIRGLCQKDDGVTDPWES
ncbi:MAG: antitoxin [Candidatus Riflebacteria bacterium HGW-Riflebacteria-1]|jgi:antitoxin (DNA-binding transcriptional repressor) of toxin-antitoxin stability system|nr:MAG: antitoxin [Candidatus Riflebacteria bacterium HGW-Riflebacteria-1]